MGLKKFWFLIDEGASNVESDESEKIVSLLTTLKHYNGSYWEVDHVFKKYGAISFFLE